MGSINKSHNEADGGILLFNGELILLYCDSVNVEIGGKESMKGRVYLTTHRLVIIVTPYRQNAPVKSLCAPFCAITKCNVEQPVFSANYIEATVRDETDSSKSFSFKLKFSKGGAIELAMAMNRAVSAVGRNYNSTMAPPPAYTPSPSAQYYQAPPTVYAPGYNCGVQMPTQQFPDAPPIGFIYASSNPPPYPGLGPQGGVGGGPGVGQQAQGGYPAQQSGMSGYPQQQQPPQQQYGGGAGYPQQQQQAGYPQQQQQAAAGYPQQQQQSAGYPMGQDSPYGNNYPTTQISQQPGAGLPASQGLPPQQAQQQQSSSSGYPDLSQQQTNQSAWPTAPSFNPNWQEDKKSA